MLSCIVAVLLFSHMCDIVHAATNVCYNPVSRPLRRVLVKSYFYQTSCISVYTNGHLQDGTQTTDATSQPCFPSANVTHCCGTGETCLKNGLCLLKVRVEATGTCFPMLTLEVQNDTSLNTGLCTDSTWQDQACFPRCLTPRRRQAPSSVYRCSNNKWCCSDGVSNATSCCQDQDIDLFPIIEHAAVENGSAFLHGYSIAPIASILTNGVGPTTTPLQTLTFTTDISGSPVTITATTTGDPTALPVREVADHQAVLTSGLGAGLGIGIPLLAAIGVLSFLLFREKRRHRATVESISATDNYGYPLVTNFQSMVPVEYQPQPDESANQSPYNTQQPAEVDATMSFAHRIEADAREKRFSRQELPGS